MHMTLLEMSQQYRADAAVFADRIHSLEGQLHEAKDMRSTRALRQRIDALRPLLQQSRSTAHRLEHYYDRRYRH